MLFEGSWGPSDYIAFTSGTMPSLDPVTCVRKASTVFISLGEPPSHPPLPRIDALIYTKLVLRSRSARRLIIAGCSLSPG